MTKEQSTMYKLNKRGLIELPACLHIWIPFNHLPFRRLFREHSERDYAVCVRNLLDECGAQLLRVN